MSITPKIYEYEILEAIANAGLTFSPEADGRYIMRECDVRDLILVVSVVLRQRGVDIDNHTRYERYLEEWGASNV
jgi:hypothetical protein